MHTTFMQQAIALARWGMYTARPNPLVGCVLVKHGQIIGRGFHPKAGERHAEIYALRDAQHQGHDVAGATAYVTLEPCAHYGRTPPCALALIEAKIAKVIIACLDANPLVAGKGVTLLNDAGIDTEVGVFEQEAVALNAGFLRTIAGGLPWVQAKIGMSLDGRTAMANGESKWITGVESRLDVQRLRAEAGAVITGVKTVLCDHPQLNVREPQAFHDFFAQTAINASALPLTFADITQPLTVVLDRQAQLAAHRPLLEKLATAKQGVGVLWCTERAMPCDIAGVQHYRLPSVASSQQLRQVLLYLAKQYQVRQVMLEAGATLTTAFLQAGLVDEWVCYVAPTLLGSSARAMLTMDIPHLSAQRRMHITQLTQLGDDVKMILQPL